MTLDQPYKPTTVRPSTTPNAPRLASRRPHTPSNVRSPVPTPSPDLRRGAQYGRVNANAAEGSSAGATPAKVLLSSNITPRSGSRKARVDSASSTPRRTPDSTPPVARPSSMIEGRDWPSGGLKLARGLGNGVGVVSRPARAQSVVSNAHYSLRSSVAGDEEKGSGSGTTNPENLPKFFYANEAKPTSKTRARAQSPRLEPKLAGSPHVNGTSITNVAALSASPEPDDDRSKSFHADETHADSHSASRLANNAFSARPPLQTIFSSYQTTNSPVQRPPSPLKVEVLPLSRKSSLNKPSPRRHTRLVSGGSNDIRAPDVVVKRQSDISRRSSLNNGTRRISQPQSPITGNFGKTTSRRSSIALSDSGRQPAPMPLESTPAKTPSPEPPNMMSPGPSPTSPSKTAPGQSKLDHLNELAADARRERKVLDLEISNSSLLAINRTLETEMRKQKAELRHLRRLRSSGRFPSSTRSASSKFSMASAIDDMSAASSADEDGMDDDGFSNFSSGTSDDTSFPDSLSFSPTPRNSSVPVTNKSRRSRSFKLDLSAQRVLLQDSQKLNQAFKRCLVRTDELIAEGKRALQYQVNTGDVAHLGPRVLTPDERGEELQLGRGLLSPGLEEKTEMPWERTRSVGNTWSDLQPGSSEGLRLDIPADGDQGGIGDGEEPDTLESETKDILEAIYQDVPLPSDEVSLHEPRTPDKLDIPYIDPGIDTGGETPSAELDSETHKEDNSTPPHETSSSSASTEAEESTISSPGKGLGDFLRMVGGSWGV